MIIKHFLLGTFYSQIFLMQIESGEKMVHEKKLILGGS